MAQGTPYAAYVLTQDARADILARFPAKYPKVSAHHITHSYGAKAESIPPPPEKVTVVGYHDDGASQVLVVEVDGRKHQGAHADEGTPRFYHITLSYDPAQGVRAVSSNAMLEKSARENGEAALRNLTEPFEIEVTPALLRDDCPPAPFPPPKP